MLASTPIQTLKALLAWKLRYTTSIYLSSDYIDLLAGLRGELSGSGEMEHLLTHFNSTLALANGTVFAGPLDMLNVMRDYFASALSTHNWLTQLDRKGVQEKLRRMFFQVAYPTDAKMADDDAAGGGAPAWPLQTPFLILNGLLGDELLTNYLLAARLSMLLTFKYMEVAPDRHSWAQTPLSINADYSPESNGLFIPAGILQGPFFDSASPAARNYGSIGAFWVTR